MIKFSIIVPVYKVEEYIEQCIESVLNQSYQNIEIILVDDGSPDNCGLICDNYSQVDSRIVVIHKENGGLSSARNSGIDIATGDYIIFLDSDDWLDVEYITNLFRVVKNNIYDVVVVGLKSYYEDSNEFITKSYELEHNVSSGINSFKYLYNRTDFWGAAWLFVVRKDYLIDKNIRFINGLYHEDERYSPELLLRAKNVGFCSNSYYVNRSGRKNSIINSHNIKKEFDKIFIIKDLVALSQSGDFVGVESKLIKSRCAQIYVGTIKSSYNYFNIPESKSAELRSQIKALSYVLKYKKEKKYRILYYTVKLFGIQFVGRILNIKGGRNNEH